MWLQTSWQGFCGRKTIHSLRSFIWDQRGGDVGFGWRLDFSWRVFSDLNDSVIPEQKAAGSSRGKHLERTFGFHPCPWMNPIIVHPTSALSPALEWDGTSPCGIISCLMLSQHLFQELFPLLSKPREFTSSFTQIHISPEILFLHFPHETLWNHKSDLNVTCELQENLEHSHCF